jgi:multicomponent Na+:H+ antiporter subunit G
MIAVWILLAAGLATFLLMAVALLVVKDFYARLHFLTPASTLGVVLIAAAVVVAESISQAGIKAMLVAAILVVTSPVISHATARAARIRQKRRWQPAPEENFPEEP